MDMTNDVYHFTSLGLRITAYTSCYKSDQPKICHNDEYE